MICRVIRVITVSAVKFSVNGKTYNYVGTSSIFKKIFLPRQIACRLWLVEPLGVLCTAFYMGIWVIDLHCPPPTKASKEQTSSSSTKQKPVSMADDTNDGAVAAAAAADAAIIVTLKSLWDDDHLNKESKDGKTGWRCLWCNKWFAGSNAKQRPSTMLQRYGPVIMSLSAQQKYPRIGWQPIEPSRRRNHKRRPQGSEQGMPLM